MKKNLSSGPLGNKTSNSAKKASINTAFVKKIFECCLVLVNRLTHGSYKNRNVDVNDSAYNKNKVNYLEVRDEVNSVIVNDLDNKTKKYIIHHRYMNSLLDLALGYYQISKYMKNLIFPYVEYGIRL